MALSNLVDVEFEIEKEVWNVYDLADGTRLKMRSVLTKLQRRPGTKVGEFEYNAAFQNLVMTFVHPRNKGPPGRIYTDQELGSLPKEEVNFTTELEDWNIYTLSDGNRIKVKVVVASIQKVKQEGAFNIYGEPLYIANSTNVLAPVPKTT